MADESEFGPVNLNNVEPDKLAMPDATTPAATPAVQEPRVRKPFRLNVSKEWCMKMAASEGDTEISAGVPEEVRAAPTTLADALTEIEKLHSIYIQACTGRAEFRNALRDARATIASQAAELAEAREILAGTDAGSLPNDMPLARIAEIRMDERHKYLWQVRDTCTRAEAAEAALKAAREALTEVAECNGLHMGDVLDIAGAALSPPTKEPSP